MAFFWRRSSRVTSDGAENTKTRRIERRIAVLGAVDLDGRFDATTIQCFPWDHKGETNVVSDYDIAIVNLADAGPQDEIAPYAFPKPIDENIVLDLFRAASRLLLAGGEVVVIGRPDLLVWAESYHGSHWSSLPHWTGLRLEWDEHAGDVLEQLDPTGPFASYTRQVKRYQYSLSRAELADEPQGGDGWFGFESAPKPRRAFSAVNSRALMRTRHDTLIASEHILTPEPTAEPVKVGRLTILPPLPGPAMTSVTVVLREVYRLPISTPDAPWLADVTAPGEKAINARIAEIQAEIQQRESAIRDLESARTEARRALAVLVQGDAELEASVWSVLRRLGAEVTEPGESDKEDGWLTVRLPDVTLEGVLEIKGTQRTTFDESGLKQLIQWKELGQRRGKHYKGIFIGNSAPGAAPNERPDPFGSGFRRSASEFGLVAVRTATLVDELIRRIDEGEDKAAFWRTLFTTNGVYE
jgi:hypothetical protein